MKKALKVMVMVIGTLLLSSCGFEDRTPAYPVDLVGPATISVGYSPIFGHVVTIKGIYQEQLIDDGPRYLFELRSAGHDTEEEAYKSGLGMLRKLVNGELAHIPSKRIN